MIAILSENVAASISASEIVERPESVVKELLENSLDAGATHIKIVVEQGGFKRIIVEDNGHGIPSNDLELAPLRFATSKLKSIEDLSSLTTYGFRGEGLYAISQLSRICICSRHQNEQVGREISLVFGKKIEDQIVVCNVGTSVTVENLFENAPVRKKFQADPLTENRRILDLIRPYLLAHREVQVTLSLDGKTETFLPTANRVIQFFGDKLSFCSLDQGFMKIEGYIGLKSLGAKGSLYIIVNRRPVQDALILKAVKDGLSTLVRSDKDLCGFLAITIDPNLIDCNAHPRKLIVKFLSANKVYQAVFNCIQKLRDKFVITPFHQSSILTTLVNASYQIPTSNQGTTRNTHQTQFSEIKIFPSTRDKRAKFLGRTNKGYLVFETYFDDEKILFIDPHAAHERILHEKILRTFSNKSSIQPLLLPMVVCSRIDESTIILFKSFGIYMEVINDETLITGLDSNLLNLCRGDIHLIISAVKDSLESKNYGMDFFIQKLVAKLACKSSVKLGDELSATEAELLLEEILDLGILYCPHGRPFIYQFECKKLDEWFKR